MGTSYFYANVSNSLKTKAANATTIRSVETTHTHTVYFTKKRKYILNNIENVKDQLHDSVLSNRSLHSEREREDERRKERKKSRKEKKHAHTFVGKKTKIKRTKKNPPKNGTVADQFNEHATNNIAHHFKRSGTCLQFLLTEYFSMFRKSSNWNRKKNQNLWIWVVCYGRDRDRVKVHKNWTITIISIFKWRLFKKKDILFFHIFQAKFSFLFSAFAKI